MESAIYRTKDGRLVRVDDEGNREPYAGGGYEWLAAGESTPEERPRPPGVSQKKRGRWY